MAKFKIVKISDLSIASSYEAAEEQLYGGPWGDKEQHVHVEVAGGLDADCVEAITVAEKWTKDGESDVSVDPEDQTWTHVPAYIDLQEDTAAAAAKVQAGRDSKLSELRKQRDVLALEADHELNKHADADTNKIGLEADWKTYRIALRDITSSYKDGSGDGTSALDAFAADLSDFSAWPTKPS